MPDAGVSRPIRIRSHAGSGDLTAGNLAAIVPIEVTLHLRRLPVNRLFAVYLTDEQDMPRWVIERG
jgi:hypothetical protein